VVVHVCVSAHPRRELLFVRALLDALLGVGGVGGAYHSRDGGHDSQHLEGVHLVLA